MAKLPKTSSGSPAFNFNDHITWPFFKRMMFMKDEFIGRKMTSSLEASTSSELEESFSQCHEPAEHLDERASPASTTPSSQMEIPATAGVSNQSWDSSEGSQSAKKPKRRRPASRESADFEERKLAVLEKVAATDELDVFASDIANDLRKIKCPLKLMQAKSQIRRIAEDFVMSELLPPAHVVTHTQTTPSVASPPQEHNINTQQYQQYQAYSQYN